MLRSSHRSLRNGVRTTGKGLLRKKRLFFRRNRNQSRLHGREDGSEWADVTLVEVEEGVGEIHDVLVGVDVGHGKG